VPHKNMKLMKMKEKV